MSERKGIDGREVPGAELMPTANGNYGKRKKKRGRRGRRGANNEEGAVQNGDAEVNGHDDGEVNDDEDLAEDVKPGGVDLLTSETAKLTLNGLEHASEAPSSPSLPVSVPAEAATTLTTNGAASTSSDHEYGWADNTDTAAAPKPSTSTSQYRSATEWGPDPSTSDSIVGDIYLRTAPDGTQTPNLHICTKHQNVANWFYAQTTQPYRNLSAQTRQLAIHHLTMQRYPELTLPGAVVDDNKIHKQEDWPRTLRLLVWRAVIRANFFWVNPATNRAAKPKPIVRPTGAYENHFEAFVECAADRLDRIRRDIPDAEYVAGVETEVRNFLRKVQGMEGGRLLAHLAFLLLFEEEQRKGALTAGDMQERIRRAFGVGFLEGEEGVVFMKGERGPIKRDGSVSTVVAADAIWREAMAAQL
ncbi:hypothetical protein BDY17DRAFT_161012 [Neohortaea acidophila]|uniref:Uncharacterized protein n=1 Tax=Neohortaea acidophila TaxID=245834 RepID=A0A6A6PS36_9PEZI|nr:uncharacterized protein BDY17DRAFT_161012 [Neohortaea acidophila]KAF2482501.1 hypothetical protein BDY17DRAFT_161012 [Neohortaea acidophila]